MLSAAGLFMTVGQFCSVCGRLVDVMATASTARSEATSFPVHLTSLTRREAPRERSVYACWLDRRSHRQRAARRAGATSGAAPSASWSSDEGLRAFSHGSTKEERRRVLTQFSPSGSTWLATFAVRSGYCCDKCVRVRARILARLQVHAGGEHRLMRWRIGGGEGDDLSS